MGRLVGWLVAIVALASSACGTTETPPPEVAHPPIASAAPTASPLDAFPTPPGAPRYKRVLSQRMQLSIPLPQREGWSMLRERSSFLVLEHPATDSRLAVRLWREDDTQNRAKCEQHVRLARDVPLRGHTIDSRRLDVPAGFDTQVDTGLTDGAPSDPVTGYVLAFGASARRCFAFVYTTETAAEGAEQIIGDRLAVIQTLTLEGIRLKSDLDPPEMR